MVWTSLLITSVTSPSPERDASLKVLYNTSKATSHICWAKATSRFRILQLAFHRMTRLEEPASIKLELLFSPMLSLEDSPVRMNSLQPVTLAEFSQVPCKWHTFWTTTSSLLILQSNGRKRYSFATLRVSTTPLIIATTLTWPDQWKASITTWILFRRSGEYTTTTPTQTDLTTQTNQSCLPR